MQSFLASKAALPTTGVEMSITYAGAAASALAVVALTVGCSAKTATAPAPSGKPASSSEAVTTPPAPVTPTRVDLAIPVTIVKGVVTPGNGEYQAKVGERIQFNVESDAADEMHVHTVPERRFEVRPGGQMFSFVLKAPGQVVVELHNTGTTVATIAVR